MSKLVLKSKATKKMLPVAPKLTPEEVLSREPIEKVVEAVGSTMSDARMEGLFVALAMHALIGKFEADGGSYYIGPDSVEMHMLAQTAAIVGMETFRYWKEDKVGWKYAPEVEEATIKKFEKKLVR